MIRTLRTAALFLVLTLGVAGAKDVVFAYYNVENYLPMNRWENDRKIPDAPKPEKEIKALLSMIRAIKPDILGIAEMGDESMLEDFRKRLRKAGLDYPHREWVAGADGSRHLALLSKFPIVERNSRQRVPLELDGRRYFVGRGILDVTVRITDDYDLRIVGVHLKSKRKTPEFDEAKFRAREAFALRAHLDERVLKDDPEANVLVFGDFNDTKNEFPVQTVRGHASQANALREIPLEDRHGLSWTHHWSYADIYSRIDFLFASKDLWPEINLRKSGIGDGKAWADASDHRPLHTTIRAKE